VEVELHTLSALALDGCELLALNMSHLTCPERHVLYLLMTTSITGVIVHRTILILSPDIYPWGKEKLHKLYCANIWIKA
jgi:hypothetical protein